MAATRYDPSQTTGFRLTGTFPFWIVAALFSVAQFIRLWQGHWIGDFWEHAAVVRELAERPLRPGHPILFADAPHAFYSPYALLVAVFSRLSGISPFSALLIAAAGNLVLYILSFRFFCSALFGKQKEPIYALCFLFTLFFWGQSPDNWSGFFHYYGFHFILPYPSVFAMSLSFAALGLLLQKADTLRLAVCALVFATLLITHPNTALFFLIAQFSILIAWHQFRWKTIAFFALATTCSLLPAFLWPYFPLWELLSGDHKTFHLQSAELYQHTLSKYWPVLPAIVLISINPHNRVIRLLGFILAATLVVYCWGFFSDRYGTGRIVAASMMMSQLVMGYSIVLLLRSGKQPLRTFPAVICLLLFFTAVWLNKDRITAGVFAGKRDDYYRRFDFLKKHLRSGAVVLAPENLNWFVPAMGGKVIGWPHPLHFITNESGRRADVATFFTQDAPEHERKRIITLYSPGLIVLDSLHNPLSAADRQWILSLGPTEYDHAGIRLVRLSQAAVFP